MITIGELRSTKAMESALAFAQTGHLCLATMHSNNADQALERVINFFLEQRHNQVRMDLSLNLSVIVAQRLVSSTKGEAKELVVDTLINSPLIADNIRSGSIYEIKPILKRSNE